MAFWRRCSLRCARRPICRVEQPIEFELVDRYLTSRSISSHLEPRYHAGLFFRPSVCSGPVFVTGPLAHGDRTAWLGWEDSNSEMSTQIIPLKDRIDLRESSRI